MVLSKNEAFLLSHGYCKNIKDVRLSLNSAQMYSEGEIETIYFIKDMEEAKKLYKKYKKTFERRMSIYTDKFLNNCLIVKLIEADKRKK